MSEQSGPIYWPEWQPLPLKPWVLRDLVSGAAYRSGGHPVRFQGPNDALCYAVRHKIPLAGEFTETQACEQV